MDLSYRPPRRGQVPRPIYANEEWIASLEICSSMIFFRCDPPFAFLPRRRSNLIISFSFRKHALAEMNKRTSARRGVKAPEVERYGSKRLDKQG